MSFRYQPVILGTTAEDECFAFCEVYLDNDGLLLSWTENATVSPIGNDMDDLRGSLIRMLYETERWEPVRFSDLKVGMIFKRKGDQPEPSP